MNEFIQLFAFIASLITCLVIFERRLDLRITHIDDCVNEIKANVHELKKDMSDLTTKLAVQDAEFKAYVMYGAKSMENKGHLNG